MDIILCYSDRTIQIRGIVPDILQLLTENTSIQFSPVNEKKFSDYLTDRNTPRQYLIPAVSSDNQLLKDYLFTLSYMSIPNIIFSRKNERVHVNSPENLPDGKLFLVENLEISQYMHSHFPNLDYIYADTTKEALKKVNQSKADFYIGDMITASYYINRMGYHQLTPIGQISHDLKLHMAVPREMAPLIPILNKGLAEISPV